MPEPKQTQSQQNSHRLDLIDAIGRIASAFLKRTGIWAVSLGFLMLIGFLSLGLFLYFTGDKVIALQNAASDLRILRAQHDHCQMELSEIKGVLKAHEQKITVLESKRTASLQ